MSFETCTSASHSTQTGDLAGPGTAVTPTAQITYPARAHNLAQALACDLGGELSRVLNMIRHGDPNAVRTLDQFMNSSAFGSDLPKKTRQGVVIVRGAVRQLYDILRETMAGCSPAIA